jgi:hypothetical protein
MATAEQYAKWCLMLIDGNDHIVDDVFEAMYDDGFIDEDQELIIEDDDE